MRALLVVPSLRKHDAVGNDVLFQAGVLKKEGIEVGVYAETFEPTLSQQMLDRAAAIKWLADSETQLIYHHCFLWEQAEFFVSSATRPAIVRFHNSTPPQFFARYNYTMAKAARRAQIQTETLMSLSNTGGVWAASNFNKCDAQQAGARSETISILAPYTNLAEFDSTPIDAGTLAKIDPQKTNILFVGRLVPNKNHIGLLRVLAAYKKNYSSNVVLHIVGKQDPFLGLYVDHIKHLIQQNDLSENVVFWENASFCVLHTLYSSCSVFLCMSEHEGFGVPVLEAQSHNLPVVVLERCALTADDVLGSGQLCFKEAKPILFAQAIHDAKNRQDLVQELNVQANLNVARFSPSESEKQILSLFKSLF